MVSIDTFFDSHPLPYSFVDFPYPDEPQKPRHPYLCYYFNESIPLLTTRVFNRAGLPKTLAFPKFNISWGRQFDVEEYQACTSWQKITHFSGAILLGKKNELNFRMKELKARYPGFVDFYPDSFVLPQDTIHWNLHPIWIVKPNAASKGEGIHLVSSSSTTVPNGPCVVQSYIERPLLIRGKKFDLRMYALVTSLAPVKIYIHEFGLGRFATHAYDGAPLDDLFAHLTNASINMANPDFKHSDGMNDDNPENSKWTLNQVFQELEHEGIDSKMILQKCERATVGCILSPIGPLRETHFSNVKHRRTSFEMYGIDLLIDADLNVWVLEVNISPAMNGQDSKLDWEQKSLIVTEMMNVARIIDCDPNQGCPAVDKYDEIWENSLAQTSKTRLSNCWGDPEFIDMANVRDFLEEKKKLRRFRRVFPKRKTLHTFLPCFPKMDYADSSFFEWVQMTNQERLEALERGQVKYQQGLALVV